MAEVRKVIWRKELSGMLAILTLLAAPEGPFRRNPWLWFAVAGGGALLLLLITLARIARGDHVEPPDPGPDGTAP